MSPIIDFVRRQLSPKQDVANAESNPSKERQNVDIVSRSGYLNEGKLYYKGEQKKSFWLA